MIFREDGSLILERELLLETFLQAMYAGMGIMDQPVKQQELLHHIPLLLLFDREGYYMWQPQQIQMTTNRLREGWSEKTDFLGVSAGQVLETVLREQLENYCQERNIKQEFVCLLPDRDEGIWIRGVEQPGFLAVLYDNPMDRESKGAASFLLAGTVIYKR